MEQAGEVFNQFLALVRPDSVGDIFIYTIFGIALISLFPMPDGNDSAQYLLFGVIFICIIDLLRGDGSNFAIPGFDNRGFGAFLIHVLNFVFFFITAGVVRGNTKQKAGPVPVLAVLGGIIALLYAAASFFATDAIYATF